MCNNKLIILANSSPSIVNRFGPDPQLDNRLVRKVFYFNLKS